ncbi:MAG: YncE family protein [Thermoplasmata archaeon]|nr:YncE family protein [Thermoplasmata archaeon]
MASSDTHRPRKLGLLVFLGLLLCAVPVLTALDSHAAGIRGAPAPLAGLSKAIGSGPLQPLATHGPSAFFRATPIPSASSGFQVFRAIGAGVNPWSTAYDSAKGEMYIANSQSGNVSVYSNSLGRIVTNIPIGGAPAYIAYDSGKGEMFVSSDRNVTVISDATNTVAATILVHGAPTGLAYDSAKGEVYVANYITNVVSVISDTNNTVTTTIPIHNGTNVVYDAGISEVFATSLPVTATPGTVAIISDTTHRAVGSVLVGIEPFGLAYDSTTARVYVANFGSANVSVISDVTNTLVTSIPVGNGPYGAAYDPHSGDVFVANGNSDNVSVISGATNTVVQSVGNYVGSGATGVTYDPGIDAIFIADQNLNVVAMIIEGYNVLFSESGLPGGTSWTFSYSGTSAYGPTNVSVASTMSSFLTRLPNGSYAFTINPVANFLASPARGSFNVAGAAVTVAITFSELFPVTFREMGLAAGTDWSVRFNGTSNHSTTNSIGFTATNGSYPYVLGTLSGYRGAPSAGTVVVIGAPRTVSITFNATYAITFTETGLASGTNWSVTVGGSTSFSLTTSIALVEVNGTYPYTLGAVPGWTTASYAGAVTVSGAAASKVIAWAQSTYTVTFAETGLPIGTSWSVTLNSVTVSGVGDLAFPGVANGTYTYTVGGITGFTPSPATGSVKVSGPSSPIAIVFQPSSSSSTGSTFLGLPATEGYALVGAIILVVVIAGVALALRGRGPKAPPPSPPAASTAPPSETPPPASP